MLNLILNSIKITIANSVSVMNTRNHAAIICLHIAEGTADTVDTALLAVILALEQNLGKAEVNQCEQSKPAFNVTNAVLLGEVDRLGLGHR
jgi:hypothetical protein